MIDRLLDAAWASPWPAVLAMAAVTMALRLGGYWLMGHVRLTPRVARALEALPGSIFVATVLPIALRAGVAGIAATTAAVAAMLVFETELAALAAGLCVAVGLRALGF